LVFRQPTLAKVWVDTFADARKSLADGEHVFVLRLVTRFPPLFVVAVLLAALGVAPGGLDVAVRRGTDPDVGPCGRNGKRLDALQRLLVGDPLALRVPVGEALPGATAG